MCHGRGLTLGPLAGSSIPERVMNPAFLQRNILSDRAVLRTVQVACFAAAALIPTLAFHTFAKIGLSRDGLLTGVLSVLALAFLSTVLGVFLEIRMRQAHGMSKSLE